MTKIIQCKMSQKTKQNIKIRLIKAPLVDSKVLRSVISERARAIVL